MQQRPDGGAVLISFVSAIFWATPFQRSRYEDRWLWSVSQNRILFDRGQEKGMLLSWGLYLELEIRSRITLPINGIAKTKSMAKSIANRIVTNRLVALLAITIENHTAVGTHITSDDNQRWSSCFIHVSLILDKKLFSAAMWVNRYLLRLILSGWLSGGPVLALVVKV